MHFLAEISYFVSNDLAPDDTSTVGNKERNTPFFKVGGFKQKNKKIKNPLPVNLKLVPFHPLQF